MPFYTELLRRGSICLNLLVFWIPLIQDMSADFTKLFMDWSKLPELFSLVSALYCALKGFRGSACDTFLFIRHTSGDSIYLLLYVDDLFLTGSDQQGILALLSFLHAHENMKDLGLLHYFLGMEVYRQGRTLILRQQKYALDLLPRADMLDSRPLATPLTSGTELPKLDVTSLSDPTYFILLLSRLTVTISYTPRTRIKILPLGPPFTFC